MKNEKGITLISVTIYVIVMAIVVGIIAVISGFFYNSIENANHIIRIRDKKNDCSMNNLYLTPKEIVFKEIT